MARRSDHSRAELKQIILEAAVRIVEIDSFRKLTIRKIAQEIGYTSGTLYQIFDDLDALIVEVHISTLEKLHTHLTMLGLDDDPEVALLTLASGYEEFTKANKNLWSALFEHNIPPEDKLPERYDSTIINLIDLGADALKPLYPDGCEDEEIRDARVLWASLYGILSLDASQKLSRYEESSEFVTLLIRTYVLGVRKKTRYINSSRP